MLGIFDYRHKIKADMERIVLEVGDRAAKAWRDATTQKKKDIAGIIDSWLGNSLATNNKEAFIKYLDQLGDKMETRGLTQDILDELLKDE